MTKRAALRAPFPWFGGKSRVASLVWERFGPVRNYVEPFAGSLAVLLRRPHEPGIETVNDADCHLANFWRAVAADPEEVACWADWPVNEADLHARHRWLVETARERVDRLKTDPDFYDAKVAGWWVWGQCLWIGSGWCARPEWAGRANGAQKARGVHASEYARSRNPRAGDPIDGHRRRPHLGGDGQGQGVIRKRPHLSSKGGNNGVHRPSLGAGGWQKRPVLQQSEGGRGVHRLSHQVPDLSGDSGAAGRGIHASGFESRYGKLPLLGGTSVGKGVHRGSEGLLAYMNALSSRLRRVRVCCGDFERVLGPAVTTCIGTTGVLLDPPYPQSGRAICYAHDTEEVWWRARQWALDHGEDEGLRIALCGYEAPDTEMPASWECVAWKSSGGYGRSERGKANARRERIWFSPHCLKPAKLPLFDRHPEEPAHA